MVFLVLICASVLSLEANTVQIKQNLPSKADENDKLQYLKLVDISTNRFNAKNNTSEVRSKISHTQSYTRHISRFSIKDIPKDNKGRFSPKSRDELVFILRNKDIKLGDINTSQIDDMSFLFAYFPVPKNNACANIDDKDENGQISKFECLKLYAANQCAKLFPNNIEIRKKCIDNAGYRVDFSGIQSWDTSNVKNMRFMFYHHPTFNADISTWNTSNVENMGFMFEGGIFNQNIERWNVSKVEDMRRMFYGNKDFNQPLEKWNTHSLKDAGLMFAGFLELDEYSSKEAYHLDLPPSFRKCKNFSSFNQPLEKWYTKRLQITALMFACSSFDYPLNKWKLPNAEITDYMFLSAKGLTMYKQIAKAPKWYKKLMEANFVYDVLDECYSLNPTPKCLLEKFKAMRFVVNRNLETMDFEFADIDDPRKLFTPKCDKETIVEYQKSLGKCIKTGIKPLANTLQQPYMSRLSLEPKKQNTESNLKSQMDVDSNAK